MPSRNPKLTLERRSFLKRAALLATTLFTAIHAGAEEPPAMPEYRVKAAFLVKLTAFVEWPESAFADAGSPFVIGLVGRDPFYGALDSEIEGRTVGKHPIVVVQARTPEEMLACHMLFVVPDPRIPLRALPAEVGRRPILTVGDEAGFARRIGIIGFYIENERVRFEIHPKAAERAGLGVSSKLLAISKVVPGQTSR